MAAAVPALLQARPRPKPGSLFVCTHEATSDRFDYRTVMEGWAKAGTRAVEPNLVKVREFARTSRFASCLPTALNTRFGGTR